MDDPGNHEYLYNVLRLSYGSLATKKKILDYERQSCGSPRKMVPSSRAQPNEKVTRVTPSPQRKNYHG